MSMWKIAPRREDFHCERIFCGTELVAIVGNSDETEDRQKEHARLIAAAPEMREALVRIMSAAGNPDAAEGCRIIIAIAQAAIAKAEREI